MRAFYVAHHKFKTLSPPKMRGVPGAQRGCGADQSGGFTGDSAAAYRQSGKADAVSFGRPFVTNPDLITPTYAGTVD